MIQIVPKVRHGDFRQRNRSKEPPAALLPSIGSLIDIDQPPGKYSDPNRLKSLWNNTYFTFSSNLCNVHVVHLGLIHSSYITKLPTTFFRFGG